MKDRLSTCLVIDAANRGINLHDVGTNPAQLYCLPVRQLVHCLLRKVEPITPNINGEDIDALAIVCELPASAAGGRVISANGGCAADSGKAWKRAEREVSKRLEPVRAFEAGDGGKRRTGVIVRIVPRD